MSRVAHFKITKRYWLKEGEEKVYNEYLDLYSESFFETDITNKAIYTFYKILQEVDEQILREESLIPYTIKLEKTNPFLYYSNEEIDNIKLDIYIKYLNKVDNENFIYIAYLDNKNDFELNGIELEFLLRASKYDDIFYNNTYEELLRKGLSKKELYKAGVLINTWDISFENLDKYIFNTSIGETYLTIEDIKTIGEYIINGEIIKFILEVGEETPISNKTNSHGIHTSLNEIDKTILSKYKIPKENGKYIAILKFRVWGNKTDLRCFFETIKGDKLILYTWWSSKDGCYTPRYSDINFAEVEDNTRWEIDIKENNRGILYWAGAKQIN